MASKRHLHLTFFLYLLALTLAVSPSTRQVSPNLFSCTSSNTFERTICNLALTKLNAELESSGIAISRNELLFTYTDDTERKIPTGHSCVRRAKLQSQHFSARFTTQRALNLSASSLIEPVALQLRLPVVFSGRLNMVQRLGSRFLGSCLTKLTDHFSFLGSLSTTAHLLVGLHLNPSLGSIPSGDYALVIEPRVAVLSSLENTDIKFRVSGANPIAAVYTALSGLTSTFLKTLEALLVGESASKELEGVFQKDILYPLVLGVGSLPRPIEEALFERFLRPGEKALNKAGKQFGEGLEESLREEVARALKVDDDGKRTIILKKDVVNLIRLGGVNLDAFIEPPQDPSVECLKNAQVGCIGSRGSLLSGCTEKFKRCQQLGGEHRGKYAVSGLKRSKSKIEAQLEVDRAPIPQTGGSPSMGGVTIGREECIQQANQLCSACRGCSQCVQRQRFCREIKEEKKSTPNPGPAPVRDTPPPGKSDMDRCIEQANKLCSACRGCSECVARQKGCRGIS